MPKRKYQSRPLEEVNGVRFKGHHLCGVEFTATGSKGKTYHIDIKPEGIECSCPGFTFYRKCKHVVSVADAFAGKETLQ